MNVSKQLDDLPTKTIEAASEALLAYESETDEWICENQDEDGEYDDEAYDSFCEEILPEILGEAGVSESDFSLLMSASCGDWEVITDAMENEINREIVQRVFSRI